MTKLTIKFWDLGQGYAPELEASQDTPLVPTRGLGQRQACEQQAEDNRAVRELSNVAAQKHWKDAEVQAAGERAAAAAARWRNESPLQRGH